MTLNKVTTANTGHLTLFPSTSTSSISMLIGAGAVAVGSAGSVATVTSKPRKIKPPDIESAVYAHIQALRALGKTKVTPEEIAQALGLSVSEVQGTIAALRHKGVKPLHGR